MADRSARVLAGRPRTHTLTCTPLLLRMRLYLALLTLSLSGLTTFAGALCRRYGTVELARLLEYTAQRLKRDDVTDLVMLRELLAKLGGVESLADAGEGALDAQAGCWALRFEVRIPPHTHTHT
jgi:hypothetical protein